MLRPFSAQSADGARAQRYRPPGSVIAAAIMIFERRSVDLSVLPEFRRHNSRADEFPHFHGRVDFAAGSIRGALKQRFEAFRLMGMEQVGFRGDKRDPAQDGE